MLKMTDMVDQVLPKFKMTSWNVLICLQSSNIQVTVIEENMTFNYLFKKYSYQDKTLLIPHWGNKLVTAAHEL